MILASVENYFCRTDLRINDCVLAWAGYDQIGGERSVHVPPQDNGFDQAILHIISGCLFRMMSRYLAKVAKFVTH